jgi:multidrug efflux system membrane fusion protein
MMLSKSEFYSVRGLVRQCGLVTFLCVILAGVAAGCSSSAQEADGGGRGGGGRGGGRGGRNGGGRGGQPVTTTTVAQRDVPVDIAAVGNVEAYNTISVRSQVTGVIQQVFFKEGDPVKKGDELFLIDPRPLQSALEEANATLIRDQALLNQAEAQLDRDSANAEYQQVSAERTASLVTRGLLSKDAGEQARSASDSTLALVKADRAGIASAKAQVDVQQSTVNNAKVQLEYTVIRSPIDGRTGNITVKVGNLVAANNAELVTIAQLQPVYVTFAVPAVHLPTIKQHLGADKLVVVASPQDSDNRPATGALTFVDSSVDTNTDTIKLKATFPNTDMRLWPGQFTRVSLELTTVPNATVVPTQAVQTGQDGEFVFVVKADSTVDQRAVTVGQRMNDDVVITKGLKPGEVVVTEGQLRLEPGIKVQLNNPTPNGNDAGGGRGGRGGGRGQGGGNRPRNGQGQGGQGQGGQGKQGA